MRGKMADDTYQTHAADGELYGGVRHLHVLVVHVAANHLARPHGMPENQRHVRVALHRGGLIQQAQKPVLKTF